MKILRTTNLGLNFIGSYKKGFLYYFYVKTKIRIEFYICVSVSLNPLIKTLF